MKDGAAKEGKLVLDKARRKAVDKLIRAHPEEFAALFREEKRIAFGNAGLPLDLFRKK